MSDHRLEMRFLLYDYNSYGQITSYHNALELDIYDNDKHDLCYVLRIINDHTDSDSKDIKRTFQRVDLSDQDFERILKTMCNAKIYGSKLK